MEYTYMKGLNVGGWLNQYEDLTDDLSKHLPVFFTEKDAERIANWGADHIRVPFNAHILTEETFQYMDACLEWCNKRGMGVIFDLHYVPGMEWDPLLETENPLFHSTVRTAFLEAWDKMSNHFAGRYGTGLRYELLNEVTDETGYLWNQLYPEAVKVIRKREPDRVIVVGSNRVNDVARLIELRLLDDENIIYNFHYYEPHVFTHQKAPFDSDMKRFNHAYPYPCFFGDELYAYLKEYPDYMRRCPGALLNQNDKHLMERNLRPAVHFMRFIGKPLYCGEFGVITTADPNAAAGWIKDFVCCLRERNIGYAMWSYKVRDFGIVNLQDEIVRPLLPDILFK